MNIKGIRIKAVAAGLLIDIAGGSAVGSISAIFLLVVMSNSSNTSLDHLALLGLNIIGLFGTTFFTGFGGYVAARRSLPNGLNNSFVVGLLSILLLVCVHGNSPDWKLWIGIILSIPAALLGGRIAMKCCQDANQPSESALNIKKYFIGMISPNTLRNIAFYHSDLSALVINAVNGALIALTALLLLKAFFLASTSLVLITALLYGPLLSLSISTIYPRIQFWVGKKAGGKASLNDLYRIFAWSFFPVGLISGLTSLAIILSTMNSKNQLMLTVTIVFAASIPLLILLSFAIRNYCSNIFLAQQLSPLKGRMSIAVTPALFLIIPTWIIVFFSIIRERAIEYRKLGKCNEINREEIRFNKTGFVLTLFYAALLSWFVLFDEKPDSLVQKELNTPIADIFMADNAWMAFLAFSSQSGGPPFIKEKNILLNIKTAIFNGDLDECTKNVANMKKDQLSFKGKIPEFYGRKDNGICEYVLEHNREVDSLLQNNKQLLERYNTLYKYNQYAEPLDFGFSAPNPEFPPIRHTQKIKLMQIAQVAQKGDLNGALLAVQRDADFWRFIAVRSRTLIPKLISIGCIGADFRFAAELCAHHHVDKIEWETVQSILRPFDQDEASNKKAIHGEAYQLIKSIEIALRINHEWSFASFFMKQNATRNRFYSIYQKEIELSEKHPQSYAADITGKGLSDGDQKLKFSFIYNPVGELLAFIVKPDFSKYAARGHNLEGIRRLAILKIQSGMENVKTENMLQFLKSKNKDLANPYTGGPMSLDFEKQRIYFNQVIDKEKSIEIYL